MEYYAQMMAGRLARNAKPQLKTDFSGFALLGWQDLQASAHERLLDTTTVVWLAVLALGVASVWVG